MTMLETLPEQCERCGRKLKSEKARKVGMGRICEIKTAEEKAKREAEEQAKAVANGNMKGESRR